MLCDELHMCGTHGEKKELPSLLLAAAALYTRLNKWNIEGFFGVFPLPYIHFSKSLSCILFEYNAPFFIIISNPLLL